MPAPLISADFNAWAEELEQRLASVESPASPTLVFACTKAQLPSAAIFINCIVRITDLDILAHSNGVNWLREDTGAIA